MEFKMQSDLMRSTMSNSKRKHKTTMRSLLVGVFESNLLAILAYLPATDIRSIKLISKEFYYLLITKDIWLGLRVAVVNQKIESLDDYQFVEEIPKPASQQEKCIRIHSLRKAIPASFKTREASNKKKIALSTINNDLPFRSTQIGFRRILGPQLARKSTIKEETATQSMSSIEIPKGLGAKDLIMNAKDPFTVNLQRANSLASIVKKWNETQHRFITAFKQTQREFVALVKKTIKLDKAVSSYVRLFETDPYRTIAASLLSGEKELLIDAQLNKVGRIFCHEHATLLHISAHLEKYISSTHQACVAVARFNTDEPGLNNSSIVQLMHALEDSADRYQEILSQCPKIIQLTGSSLVQIYEALIHQQLLKSVQLGTDHVALLDVTFAHLGLFPDYFELFLHALLSFLTKLSKLFAWEEGEKQPMSIHISLVKIRHLRQSATSIWNVAKYFVKLRKQLDANEKKKDGKATIIRAFLREYCSGQNKFGILREENSERLQKELGSLKGKISELKGAIQEQSQ